MSMTRIRDALTKEGATAAKKLFHVFVINERKDSIGSDHEDHRHERSTGMVNVDHDIRSKLRTTSTETHERNPQRKVLSFGT